MPVLCKVIPAVAEHSGSIMQMSALDEIAAFHPQDHPPDELHSVWTFTLARIGDLKK